MAAVTKAWDNKIYVYDFSSQEWGEFELYNPTYSEDINSGGTVYADALEWDYTGEFIVYDAFNRIENANGPNIEYWDVNFIHAWNLESKSFGEGTISKLFSSLPAGVSIGNPTFAKLSPNILAFDMVDDLNQTYAILGSNIETGETDVIFENNTIGYPSFNKSDTRIAFTLDAGVDDYYTGLVNLTATKIASNDANETAIFLDTMWPVYFSSGKRDVGEEVTAILPEQKLTKLVCYPNPFQSNLTVDMGAESAGKVSVEILNMLGQQLSTQEITPEDKKLALTIPKTASGTYIVKIKYGSKTGICRAVQTN